MNVGFSRYLLSQAPFNSKTSAIASVMGLSFPRWTYVVSKILGASMYANTLVPYRPEFESKLIPGIQMEDDSLLVLSQQAAPQHMHAGTATFPLTNPVVEVTYTDGTLSLASNGLVSLPYTLESRDGAKLLKVEWPSVTGELGDILVPDSRWADSMTFKFSALLDYPSAAVATAALDDTDCFEFLNKQGYVEAVYQCGHPDEQIAIMAAAICKSLA